MTDRARQERAGRRILVVDDDERVRTVVCWQLEADGFTVEQACDGIEALVGEVLDLLAPLAVQRGVTLDRGALDGVVRADRRRLRQIVINLVTNGVRYHHGDGWVRVEAVPVPGTGELAVRVVDNGPGIPSALLGRLFVPFDRLGRETARAGAEPEPGQGAGLGLMLARGLTEAMAGRLEVRSVEGAGTTVEVVLPGAYVISTAARRDRV